MSDIDPDTLASKIAASLRGFKPAAEDDDDGGGSKVPRERLNREIAARKAAEAKVAEMLPQFDQLTAAHAARLAAKDTDFLEQSKRQALAHSVDMQLSDKGFRDPLGRKALRDAYEAAPKDARGKTEAEYLDSLIAARAAHLADPEKVAAPAIPMTISGYLPPVEAPAPAPTGRTQTAPQRSPAPPTPRTAKGVDSAPVDQGMDAFFEGLRGLTP